MLRPSLPAGYIPTAVAIGDFNGDGNPDFVVGNGGDNTLWLYFGKGDGTFSLPIILPITKGQTPIWITTTDLRGIGKTDIIIAEPDSNSVGVFLGNGDGTFVENSIGLRDAVYSLAVGDFNQDGKLDIVAAGSGSGNFLMLPGKGDGTFGQAVVSAGVPGVFWLSTADLNGDGYSDLVESTASTAFDYLAVTPFLNNRDGTFSQGQAIAQNYIFGPLNLGSLLFDADEDGKVDALVADTFGTLWFYHGNGDGTFSTNPTTFQIGDVPFGMVAADVNGDGHMDAVLSGTFVNDLLAYGVEAGDQICVLQGDGKGDFSFPTVYRGDSSSYALALGDFNKDGHPDLVTANQYNDSATVFLNDGLGGFGSPQGGYVGYDIGPVNAPMSGALITDVDGDGSPDVALMEFAQSPDPYYAITVLLNDGKGNLTAPIHSDAVNTSFSEFGDFVLADFRNTGHPDFLAVQYNYLSYMPYISFAPNVGGGHFGPPVATTPPNAAGVIGVGDFNADGKLDFVAAGFCGASGGNCLQVFNGNGDGTFGSGYMQSFGMNISSVVPAAIYVGDFNRDGKLDLLVFLDGNNGWTTGDDVYEFFGNGDGTFQIGIRLFSHFGPMVVADVNGDGHPDIVNTDFQLAANGFPQPAQFSIYLGQADGSFALASTYAPYGYGGVLAEAPVGTIQHFAPMVADFNGDGKVDIAAFQADGNNNRDMFVQFMLGNGDGTFTPTYDVFDFRKPWFEGYAADVRGIGRSDMFELNGYRSTYNLLQSVTASPFQLAMIDDPIVGNTGSAILLLDVPSASSTTFALVPSDPAITVPATITIPAGQVSKTFNFTVGSGFNRNHVFSISASAGGASAVEYGTVVRSGSAGFQAQVILVPSWPNLNLAAGQTLNNLRMTVQSVNDYSSTLDFTCLGLAQQGQCQFMPSSINLRSNDYANLDWTFSVNPGISIGSYPGTVRVTDGLITQNLPFTLNVGDFSMSLSPSTIQVLPTDLQNTTLTLTSINQFDQTVSLSCSGLPSGATCTLAPFGTPLPVGAPMNIGIQTLSAPTGTYQVTLTGTSSPVTHTAVAQVQVWDFTGSVNPMAATVKAGSSATFTITANSVNGFNGTLSPWCFVNTSLVSCAFNPSTITVSANGTSTSTLTITASSRLGSRQEDRQKGRRGLGTFAFFLASPLGALAVVGHRGHRTRLRVLLLILAFSVSCGGGAGSTGGTGGGSGGGGSGGGGGGGTSQTYSIIVKVNIPNTPYTKDVGPITLTVN